MFMLGIKLLHLVFNETPVFGRLWSLILLCQATERNCLKVGKLAEQIFDNKRHDRIIFMSCTDFYLCANSALGEKLHGTLSMADTPSYLDYVFFATLSELKPFITCVNNGTYIELIKRWLDKLSDVRITDKAMRNNYLFLLETQIKDGVLTTPFTNEPPEHIFEDSIDDEDFTCDSPLEPASSDEMFSCRVHYPKSPHSLPSTPRIEEYSDGSDAMVTLEEKLASGMANTDDMGRRINNLADKVAAVQEDTCAEGPLLVRKQDVAVSAQTERNRSIKNRLHDMERMHKQFMRRNQDTKLRMQTLHEWYKRKFSELKFSLRQKFTEEYEEKVRELEQQFQTTDDKERRRFEAEMDKLQTLYDSLNQEREHRLEKEREERERREERDREERHRREAKEREERDRREREERERLLERERREEEARREERERLERRMMQERLAERERLEEVQRRLEEERREEKQQREEKERRDEEERRAERERLELKELRLEEERRMERERLAEIQRQIEEERRAEKQEREERDRIEAEQRRKEMQEREQKERVEAEQRSQAKLEREEKERRAAEKRHEEKLHREQEMQRLKEERRQEKRQREVEINELRALYERNITELRATLMQDFTKQRDEWCKKSDKLQQQCADLEQQRVSNRLEIAKLKEMGDEFRATIEQKDAKLQDHERLRRQLETDREQSQAEARGQLLHYQNVIERERVQFRENLEKQQQNLAALEARLAKERQQHDEKVAELNLQTSAQRSEYKNANGRCKELHLELECAQRNHEEAINAIRTEHESQVAELQAQHKLEIDAKDARLEEITAELSNKCNNSSTEQFIQDIRQLKSYVKTLRELLLHSENRFNERFDKALRENDFQFKRQEILMSISRVNLIADVTERRYREFSFSMDKLQERFVHIVEEQQQHFAQERREFVDKIHKLRLSNIMHEHYV